MTDANQLREFLIAMPKLTSKRSNVIVALAHLENRMEELNIRGDFDGGLNLLGPIETLRERLQATEQLIWDQIQRLFNATPGARRR